MVNIRIKENCNPYKDEYRAAKRLKEIFLRDIPLYVTGNILIVPSAKIYGAEAREIDLVVIGSLSGYMVRINNTYVRYKDFATGKTVVSSDPGNYDVTIQDFCFTIEVKSHDRNIQFDGTSFFVPLPNNPRHNASDQSHDQKYELVKFFQKHFRSHNSPFIYNFLWFTSVPQFNIAVNHNALTAEFNVPYLFAVACTQYAPYRSRNTVYFNSFRRSDNYELNNMENLAGYFDIFNSRVATSGQITRTKLETLSKRLVDNQQYAQGIGEKLVIFKGKAGTGKTFKLLRVAFDLARDKAARCLILTYNKALVSDIKRLIYYAGWTCDDDFGTVSIQTIMSYFFALGKGVGIIPEHANDFTSNYEYYLSQMLEAITIGALTHEELMNVMRSNRNTLAWDYILIDECQDCNPLERDILFLVTENGYKNIIVADGTDQLVRGTKRCNWIETLQRGMYVSNSERRSLRQKKEIVNFINEFAQRLEMKDWAIEPTKEMLGGKIIITTMPYDTNLHNREFSLCQQAGNVEYDYLFLVPPSFVGETYAPNGLAQGKAFLYTSRFMQCGIPIWDGTNSDSRETFPDNPDLFRVLQYESCRGLEGWTVVCYNFDEFIQHKKDTFRDDDSTNQMTLETFEEKQRHSAHRWALIPLTRAIDTLIITLQDKNSEYARILYEISLNHPDCIEFIGESPFSSQPLLESYSFG